MTGADDLEEEEGQGAPAVRLGDGATEPSGDSGAGLAPSHSGQCDSTGTGNEGQATQLKHMSSQLEHLSFTCTSHGHVVLVIEMSWAVNCVIECMKLWLHAHTSHS